MDVCHVVTSSLGIHLCGGILLAVVGCQMKYSTLFVQKLPVDSSTLGVTDHHSGSC